MTLPGLVATMSFCIFIASRTATTSPSLTSSPTFTGTLTISPCIGATTAPSAAGRGGGGPEAAGWAPPDAGRGRHGKAGAGHAHPEGLTLHLDFELGRLGLGGRRHLGGLSLRLGLGLRLGGGGLAHGLRGGLFLLAVLCGRLPGPLRAPGLEDL